MERELQELKIRLNEVSDFEHAASVLEWDMATYMPPAGAERRGRATALLSRLGHEHFTRPEIGRLLDALEAHTQHLPHDDDAVSLVRVTRREYEKAVRVPAELVGAIAEHTAAMYDTWTRARPNNDFASLSDMLERELDLFRQMADCFPGYQHITDPLIANADYGMTSASISALFAELRTQLVPIVQAIVAQQPADDSMLRRHYPVSQQEAFGVAVIRDYGYSFERGRQDLTHHPFMIRFGTGDIRITTRFDEHNLADGLFSTLHEAGHALYELGIDPAFDGTPLGGGTSAGVHESQSRTWENVIGRSRGFWEHYYPQLQELFPQQLADVPLDAFYRGINAVRRSLIRVDADEVTYNLHVMIRFDLERQLMEGSLAVRDLPEAWQQRYHDDLGITAPDDRDGVLQDVHWYSGGIGGFQGYTLGNLMGAQFYRAALQAHPEIPDQVGEGRFDTLLGWLGEHVYRHGSKFTAAELLTRVTGGDLQINPWIDYIRTKYGALYTL